tara:strand:+ start:150 stop:584 length:435 start_codon:yes stop_codon:yes gene_type:complete
MKDVYLYFRAQATIGSDQDKNDSCLFPLSSYAGLEASSASGVNTVTLYFKSMLNHNGMDQADASETISDSVALTLSESYTVKDFIKDFTAKLVDIKKKRSGWFMVADDCTSNDVANPELERFGTSYFSPTITAVSAITIANAHS